MLKNLPIAAILSMLQLFFSSNPAVEEIEAVLPAILNAIGAAKQGQQFSIGIPLAVDAVKGTATFSWAPA